MAATIFNCPSCGIGYGGSCCPTCQPAQAIFRGECQDPGTLSPGRFLQVLDYKFCEHRLTNAPGFLVANQNGSGNFGIAFSTTPQVQLGDVSATANTAFGQLIVMGSDYRWRALNGPASAGLFMQTDATGNVIFGSAPAATVPDPLAVNDLSVAANATIANLTTSGTVTLNNIASGTVVNLLALNASNQLITQAISAGVAGCMFYESASSPGSGVPNFAKNNGEYLIIGNRLFDSGANLISVTTSESITVNVAGKYLIVWGAECRWGTAAHPSIQLEINGVIVSNGLGRNGDINNGIANTLGAFPGFEMRALAVGDVIKLLLSTNSSDIQTVEARLIAVKFAD